MIADLVRPWQEAVSKPRGGKLPACRSLDAVAKSRRPTADAGSIGHEGLVLILTLQSRVNRFALQGENAEDAFMNPAERFSPDETLQGFDAQSELSERK